MKGRLTIAIPTFNRVELLARALDSALAQTSDRVSILVSDNASTDGTRTLLREYDDPRLRVVTRDHTVSRAHHGALIFSEVETEFVLALSDDDYVEPKFAERVLVLFDENPNVSFVYTGCVEHYDDEQVLAKVGPPVEDSLDFMFAHYAGERQLSWCACVCRAADLRRLGPQPEDRIIGDMFFWTKLAFEGPVGCVPEPLAHYSALRPGGDNESRTTPIVAWAKEVDLLGAEVMTMVTEHGAGPKYRRALARNMRAYRLQSVVNQFVWARIQGASRIDCLVALPGSVDIRGMSLGRLLRLIVAMVLSRGALRDLALRVAVALRRRAEERKSLVVQ